MDTIKEKIGRFTSGKFSFNDYLSVRSLFREEDVNVNFEKILEDDWAETDITGNNQKRLSNLLDKLHYQINLRTTEKEYLFSNFYRLFSKIAVVLIIPLLMTIAVLSYLTINNSDNADSWVEIHSPLGARTKFQLPDGTQGWLNSGSSIKYLTHFNRHRNVEVSGEAWFDVVHQKSKEFRVITKYFDVSVLGTQFDVLAYEDEPTAEVILERGKVIVFGKDNQEKGTLVPDQQLVFDKTRKKYIKSGVDSKIYTSWKDGLLIFKNISMADISRRLERRYNTEIILHGDSLKQSIFRATFQDENLQEICKMLATVAPVKYKIYKREIQPDGTFAKGKVEMWLINNINKN